jgi:hypothetical protein
VNVPDTPLLLFLHWHGFRRATPLRLEGVDLPARPVPSSALQFDGPWPTSTSAEEQVLDAAWRLGAWSVERLQQRACNSPGAPASEAYACRLAFGDNAADYPEEPVLGADLSARARLMGLAAQKGYARWLFQPVTAWKPMAGAARIVRCVRCRRAAIGARFISWATSATSFCLDTFCYKQGPGAGLENKNVKTYFGCR